MSLSKRDMEKLVMSVDDKGEIYFREIHRVLPNLDKEDMYEIIGDDLRTDEILPNHFFKNPLPLLFWVECPDRYRKGYDFRANDLFCLSTYGDDIRYAKTKELETEKLTKQTLKWAKISATLSAIAIVVSIVLAIYF